MIRHTIFICLLALLLATASTAPAKTARTALVAHTKATSYKFEVEIANTPNRQVRGMVFRQKMRPHQAVLFDYRGQQLPLKLWLNNTTNPLDIIIIDWQGKVIDIHKNIPPRSKKRITLAPEAMFVLQINSGMAKRIGIIKSTTIDHRIIQQSAQKQPAHLIEKNIFDSWF